MSTSDDPLPSATPKVDTGEFFFAGSGLSVLLIHGLTGTPYEMRFLGERLASDGMRVLGVKLAGHAGRPEELGAANEDNWYESVVQAFERLCRYPEPRVAVGLSAGAVLAARLAVDQRAAVAGLVMLSPAFFLPRLATAALKATSLLGPLANRIYLRGSGSDIHDDAARRIHPRSHLMPLGAPIRLLALSAAVRGKLSQVVQPTLIVHSRRDHTCPVRRNVNYLMNHLGTTRKRAVILEHSFHVITVDSEKDRVVAEVAGFLNQFRAASEQPNLMEA